MMLTHLKFESSEVDLSESFHQSFKKKKAKILALEGKTDSIIEAGSISYSIFDFNYFCFDLDDAIAEDPSKDWGETEFFSWITSNMRLLQKEIPFLDKLIFIQELDLQMSKINSKTIELLFDVIRNEHNIYTSVINLDILYDNPKAGLRKIFKKLGWKELSQKYWLKL